MRVQGGEFFQWEDGLMATGTVKWFDSKKGFGFIVGPEGKDVFVHFTRIEGQGFRSLRDGEQVEYEHTSGEKGLLATTVKRLVVPKNRNGNLRIDLIADAESIGNAVVIGTA